MKKIIKYLTIISIILSSFKINLLANENINSTSGIYSLNINENVRLYADNTYRYHLDALIDVGEFESDIDVYQLGEPFTILDPIANEVTYFFPIYTRDEIVSLYKVSGKETYSGSLSTYFANELNDLLSGAIVNYILLTDGVCVQAFDGKENITIYKLFESETKEEPKDLSDYYNEKNYELHIVKYNDMLTSSNQHLNNISTFSSVPSVTEIDSKTINVVGVSQGNHPWCWAATCAALINFYKGHSLTASSVANYVFPNNPEQGGNWANIKKAYSHWGLYPTQNNILSFGNIRKNLKNNKPMHLGLTGHSVALIGFSYLDLGAGSYDRILILLEPNGGVRKTVSLKSNNNFDYYLSGENAWKYTRTF